MKKSQLKEAIKNEIKSVLSEGMTDKEREDKLQQAKRGGGKEKPLRKLAAIGKKEDEENLKEDRRRVVDYDNRDDRTTELFLDNGDSVEVDVIELYDNLKENNPTFSDIRESFNPEVSRAVDRFITAMADRYGYSMQDAVYAIMAALNQRKYDGLNEVEDMDDDEMDKAAAKSAKKGDSITATSNKLQKLTAKMKKKAKEFKEAEGKAKDKLKDELKDMTAEKKELEKSL